MTKDETIEAAKKLKVGKRLLTCELIAIDLMHDDERYQMYVNEDGRLSFKLKEV